MPAGAITCDMVDHQSRIHVLVTLQEIGAADRGPRSIARKPHEHLVAYQRAPWGKRQTEETCAGAECSHCARNVQAAGARNLHVLELRIVADNDFERRIDLGIFCFVAFNDKDGSAFSTTMSERMNTEASC